MFPVPRRANELIKEWAGELSEHTGLPRERLLENPECLEFSSGVLRIVLMDDSIVEFRWAFHLVSERQKAIAVFTEHCGHHVFPYHGAKVFRDDALVYEQKHA